MKVKFKPTNKVTRDYTLWYAWRPVRISENQLAWCEPVYRRKEATYKRDKTKWVTKYMSKEDYFTKSMRNSESLQAYEGYGEDKKEDIYVGQAVSANQIRSR